MPMMRTFPIAIVLGASLFAAYQFGRPSRLSETSFARAADQSRLRWTAHRPAALTTNQNVVVHLSTGQIDAVAAECQQLLAGVIDGAAERVDAIIARRPATGLRGSFEQARRRGVQVSLFGTAPKNSGSGLQEAQIDAILPEKPLSGESLLIAADDGEVIALLPGIYRSANASESLLLKWRDPEAIRLIREVCQTPIDQFDGTLRPTPWASSSLVVTTPALAATAVHKALRKARRSIHFMTASLDQTNLREVLEDAAHQHVDVTGLVADMGHGALLHETRRGTSSDRVIAAPELVTRDYFIIDKTSVVFCSPDWSQRAPEASLALVIQLADAAVVDAMMSHFHARMNHVLGSTAQRLEHAWR